jgi:hypothetical protein
LPGAGASSSVASSAVSRVVSSVYETCLNSPCLALGQGLGWAREYPSSEARITVTFPPTFLSDGVPRYVQLFAGIAGIHVDMLGFTLST